jgi:hypothetical protein
MKCANHYDRDVVAQCIDCGKGLCPECADKFSMPICDSCELKRINADKSVLVKNSILMVVLAVIGFIFMAQDGNNSFLYCVMAAYLFAGIPWGWSFLNRITPNMFLFLSWFGWFVYFIFKLLLSMLIGMFVTPYKIYKIAKGLYRANALENYTKNNAA